MRMREDGKSRHETLLHMLAQQPQTRAKCGKYCLNAVIAYSGYDIIIIILAQACARKHAHCVPLIVASSFFLLVFFLRLAAVTSWFCYNLTSLVLFVSSLVMEPVEK